MDLGKVPPHDIEAEQAVLGSMLTDKDAVVDAVELLKSIAKILLVFPYMRSLLSNFSKKKQKKKSCY